MGWNKNSRDKMLTFKVFRWKGCLLGGKCVFSSWHLWQFQWWPCILVGWCNVVECRVFLEVMLRNPGPLLGPVTTFLSVENPHCNTEFCREIYCLNFQICASRKINTSAARRWCRSLFVCPLRNNQTWIVSSTLQVVFSDRHQRPMMFRFISIFLGVPTFADHWVCLSSIWGSCAW